MNHRDQLRATFIYECGWGKAECTFLAGDCSNRTYYRIRSASGKTAVIMDAYGEEEKIEEFVHISQLLNQWGCSAPHVLQVDWKNRFLLLEDLGDHTFTRCLQQGVSADTLYEVAIDAIIHLHQSVAGSDFREFPSYNFQEMKEKVDLFLHWYYPYVYKQQPSEKATLHWNEAWEEVLSLLEAGPKTLILRDFHVDNLLWLSERAGIKQCGLLDFQDAAIGPLTYDLVSLLEDVRQDVPEDLTQRLLSRYLAAFPSLDREEFMAQYYMVGAQRVIRIMGVFVRMLQKNSRSHYMQFIPRAWKWLENDLKHDNLESIRCWFEGYFPTETRRAL